MELVKQTRENNAYLAGYSCHDSFSVCYIFILFFFFCFFVFFINLGLFFEEAGCTTAYMRNRGSSYAPF